jgi:hypothetical protein
MKWIVLGILSGLCAAPAFAQERGATVQAICMDARGLPHPAAQTFADRDVAADYVGELFRCLPGTAMRYEAHALTRTCAAGEALWYEYRRLSCRAESALDTEQERDLLRRFGPGAKAVELTSSVAPAQPTQGPRIVDGYARPH